MKKTKIVCTIGPSCDQFKKLETLIKNGMNVARLNFSHGSYDSHLSVLKNVRAVTKKLNQSIGVIQDLQGPRFRIGVVDDKGITIKKNEVIVLVADTDFADLIVSGNKKFIPLRDISLYKGLKVKDTILIDDGLISLKVIKIINKQIVVKVIYGGIVKSNKGMNFPRVNLSLSALTEKDKKDVCWGVQNKVDFIAFSFVRSVEDVVELRNLIAFLEKKQGKQFTHNGKIHRTHIQIIAKIETVQAVKNFDEILKVVDGIMIARGDLGIEINLEQVPLLQKEMILKCNKVGKAVIVATQMLDSMVIHPLPTRAEVSDVANAILDGADVVMLSAETANGKYPLEAVQMLSKIAQKVESTLILKRQNEPNFPVYLLKEIPKVISLAINHITRQTKIDAIVCATTSGFTPRLITRYKLGVPIIALTNILEIQNQLNLSWGVEPYLIEESFCQTFDGFIEKSIDFLKKNKKIKQGQIIIFAMDYPFNLIGETNTIKIHIVE